MLGSRTPEGGDFGDGSRRASRENLVTSQTRNHTLILSTYAARLKLGSEFGLSVRRHGERIDLFGVRARLKLALTPRPTSGSPPHGSTRSKARHSAPMESPSQPPTSLYVPPSLARPPPLTRLELRPAPSLSGPRRRSQPGTKSTASQSKSTGPPRAQLATASRPTSKARRGSRSKSACTMLARGLEATIGTFRRTLMVSSAFAWDRVEKEILMVRAGRGGE